MKTVIFGGSFNPFHFGHLKLIKEVQKTVKPDRFILMPTHVAPHKVHDDLVDDADRLEMCRLAAQDADGLEVSDYEINAGGKSYTVLTLEHFRKLYPNDELYFAMGSDMLISFLNWYMPERIMELATLVCNCRDENDRAAIQSARSEIESRGGRCVITQCEALVCSSTDVRSRIGAGLPIDDLVPESVAKYIEKRGLYRD